MLRMDTSNACRIRTAEDAEARLIDRSEAAQILRRLRRTENRPERYGRRRWRWGAKRKRTFLNTEQLRSGK